MRAKLYPVTIEVGIMTRDPKLDMRGCEKVGERNVISQAFTDPVRSFGKWNCRHILHILLRSDRREASERQ